MAASVMAASTKAVLCQACGEEASALDRRSVSGGGGAQNVLAVWTELRSSCPITTDVTTLICSGLSSVYPKKRAAAVAASLICRSDIFPLAHCVYVRRCTCVSCTSTYVHSNARKI